MSEQKLIEQMAIDMANVDGGECEACEGCLCDNYCMYQGYATGLFAAGYRKQSEGEWVKTETHNYCSACNFNVVSWSGEYDGYKCERGISLMKFCPNCGAKMKGGAE